MEFISWLLDQLPYPMAITLAIVGLWAIGVKIFAELLWKQVFLSNWFIFPSLVCVYTLVLSMGLMGYTKFLLIPVEIDKTFKSGTNPTLFEELGEVRTQVFMTYVEVKKMGLKNTRAEMYEILNIIEELNSKEESIPVSYYRRKAELKIRIDRLSREITDVETNALIDLKRKP